jgi:hypothetical protein
MLLHGGYASSTMWFPNIADLSARFRVLAVDTIGELGKSFPTQRNTTNQDCAAWMESIFLEIYQPQLHRRKKSFTNPLPLLCVSMTERSNRQNCKFARYSDHSESAAPLGLGHNRIRKFTKIIKA